MKKLIAILLLAVFIASCARPPSQPWQPSKYKKPKMTNKV
jgi:PBP1b-binding outer membrane lipoprotein LpoB